ncbi:MAG TPA: surface carbohydrate biosynthesis protein [Methyloceanibacter sp.]|nr:surface carbohydrate biosynthesis protein [Methyloceanibacter sp.]
MTSKSKNFIILVEMTERELPAAVLLGTELSARGHTVRLIEKGRFRKSPASFAPSMVLEKGLTTGCLSRYRSIRRAGHLLTVMCQEGLTYRSGEDYIERRVWGETLKTVDNLFLWGERQKQDLERFLPQVRRYDVTGNPRFDLLHPRFRACWEAQEQDIKQKHGDFILFTSRFAAVNHFRRELEETLDRRSEIYTGEAQQTVNERFQYQHKLFLGFMEGVAAMASRFPDQTFVVRPHPLEDPDVWRARFEDVSNVLVRDGGPAVPWLSAARCVIHNACTTGIEAYILNRPVTEYYPDAARSELDPVLPGKVTGGCTGRDELAQWIEANMAGQVAVNRRASSDELIAHHVRNAVQPNAYTEMATAMESFRAPPPWAPLMNKVSRAHAPKKMQKRYIELGEVNALLQSFVDCKVRDRFVPAVSDDVGIRLN